MALEKFHYKVGKKEVTLPRFEQAATLGFMRRTRKMAPQDQVFELLESVADEKTLEVLDALYGSSLEAFIKAWQEDSNITVGESSAS